MIDDLTERLAQIEAEKAEIETALAAAKLEHRADTAQAVRDLIETDGYTIDEILPLLAHKPQVKVKRARSADTRTFPTYALAGDPSRMYSRGKLPDWLKDAMMVAGFDPTVRANRETFRTTHMTRVA